MTRISPRHPRYASLRVRAQLATAAREGIVVPEGLIAQGRAEAFDYLLGERSTPSARRAERLAAEWLRAARRPVVSVNGNVAALASAEIAELANQLPSLQIEVNLFHRSEVRARRIAGELRRKGVSHVLGLHPTARIPGIASDRARVDARGIAQADLCCVPLEDGDRARALRAAGKQIIAIDLNPLSRTVQAAHLAIVDDVNRALRAIGKYLPRAGTPSTGRFRTPKWVETLPRLALQEIRGRIDRIRPPDSGRSDLRDGARPRLRIARHSRRTR